MWAQIVKTRMRQGVESEMDQVREQMRGRIEQRGGLVASYWMQNQNDPQEYYTLIVFESEEQARAGEAELEDDPLFQHARSLGDGAPEFVDLNVVDAIP